MSVSTEQLVEWKAKYGSVSVIELEGVRFYYRTLTPKELLSLQELSKALGESDINMAVIRLATLYPDTSSVEFRLAGTENALSQAIHEGSVRINPKSGQFDLDEYRAWAEGIQQSNAPITLAIALSNVHPGIGLLEILDQPMENIYRLAAIVEIITGKRIFDTSETSQQSSPHAKNLRDAIKAERKKHGMM